MTTFRVSLKAFSFYAALCMLPRLCLSSVDSDMENFKFLMTFGGF